MGFFSSEAPCDACGASQSKKELNRFDATFRGDRFSEDKRRRLCAACLPNVLGEYFKSYEFLALAIEPSPVRDTGYLFAPLTFGMKSFRWTDELKEEVRSLLPKAGSKCSRCHTPARFTWCGLDIYAGSNLVLKMKPRGAFSEEPLCGACAARAFEDAYRRVGTTLIEVMPPCDDDGFIGPADV